MIANISSKRRRRREQANKAAIEEQLEIDLEQQALKVVNQTAVVKVTPVNVKKSQQKMNLNIMDLIDNAPVQVKMAAGRI